MSGGHHPANAPGASPDAGTVPPKSSWTVTASALQEDIYPARQACDGRMDTRWSSPASDPQWVSIDMGRPATVCGLVIYWETAFSREYEILVSDNGRKWKSVYKASNGDGRSDEVYFRPVQARFLKILCISRGTGWGHSIWEVDVKGPAEQPVVEPAGGVPGGLFDNDPKAGWVSPTPAPCSLTVDLRREKSLGGIRLDWGSNYATEARLFESVNGSDWKPVAELKEGVGLFDFLLHEKTEARYLRLDIAKASSATEPIQIREISLRGPDEVITPTELYRIAAEKVHPGYYPEQLRNRQVYWTVVGLPGGDSRESLLDEYGNVEPLQGGSSIMPYLWINGKLVSALDAKVQLALDGGYLPLPSVSWDAGDVSLEVRALAWGPVSNSSTFVRYIVSNACPQARTGTLFLAIRPVQINPPWQYGGLSPIRAMEFVSWKNGDSVRVTGDRSTSIMALSPVDGFGARGFDQGDIARELARGVLPPARKVDHSGDLVSGALAYHFMLGPGETRTVIAAIPVHGDPSSITLFRSVSSDPAVAFEARLAESRAAWTALVDRVTADFPARDVAHTLKSQLAYIFINQDGAALQPGSRQYERSWIRDGSMIAPVLLRMGHADVVRDFADWYGHFITPEGMVPPSFRADDPLDSGPGSGIEWDGQGAYVYLVMEYYRFTGDREFLARNYEKVHRSLEFLVKLRERTLVPDYMKEEPARERFVGILPKSFSHEGYFPEMHSYWDDFWALKGWKDGKAAAEEMGNTADAAWAEQQYQLLRASLRTSMAATMAFKKIPHIPGCAEKGDYDPASTAIAFFPCEESDLLPKAAVAATYERYYKEVRARLEPDWKAAFTPYEGRNISALMAIGEKDRAHFLLDFLMASRRPLEWNHLAEVVLGDPRMGCYIGDMPHTWAGASLVNAVFQMLVREHDGQVVLLDGAPEAWLQGDGVKLARVPTYFGPIDLNARFNGNELTMSLGGTCAPPNGYQLCWPRAGKPVEVRIDGQPCAKYDQATCIIPAGAQQVTARW